MSGAGPEEFPDTKALSRSSRSRAAAGRPGNTSQSAVAPFDLLLRAESALASNPRLALRFSRRALLLAARAGLAREQGLARRLEGHALKALERHEEALEAYAAARRWFARASDRLEAARTQIGRVDALMYLDRYDDAARVGRAVLREFRLLNEPVRAGRLLTNLGNLEYRRDRPLAALDRYRRARTLLQTGAPLHDVAMVDYNIGNILALLGKPGEAEGNYRGARDAANRSGDAVLALHADYALAGLEIVRARYPAALRLLADCERRFSLLGHERGRLNCLLDRAEAYRRLGLDAESAWVAGEAARGFRRLRLASEEARALLYAGLGLMGGDDPNRGRRLLDAAAERFRALGNPAQAAATVLRRAQADPGRPGRGGGTALDGRLRAALGVFRRLGHIEFGAEAELELARLALARGATRRARTHLDAAARGVGVAATPELASRLHHFRALALESEARPESHEEALRALAAMRALRDRLELSEFVVAQLRTRQRFHDDILRILLRRFAPDPCAVFRVTEGMSAALARDAGRGAPRAAGLSSPEVEALRDRLATLTAPLRGEVPAAGASSFPAASRRAIHRTEQALVEAVRRARVAAGGEPGVADEMDPDLGALRAALRPRDVWIQPVDTGDEIRFLVATRDGARFDPKPISKARLLAGVEEVRYQMERIRVSRDFATRHATTLIASAERSLARLAEEILPVLDGDLQRAGALLVRAGSGLEAIPWGAIPVGGGPLWARATVKVVPAAASVLHARRRRTRGARSALRRPLVWGVDDPSVPAAAREARRLGDGLSGARVFVGAEATRASFARFAGGGTLLHFAGHGFFRADNPLFSCLRFADGDLTFLDVEGLRLRAEIVVLSACRTGVGREERGLGTGLARGFLRAGARNLIATLWPIDDEAAVMLSEELYRSLREPGTPSEALRRTTLRLRDAGRHPAEWAAFQLAGTGA